ncbi:MULTISPECIES: hypothetical protein [Limosilactobacillus]|uniref:hypothetical protein n=1 Tax=Limosilactobacillus TaxID=2742598 RepID=UPI0024B36708|nr:hypothetical protein [Limosilactobacillus oris]WHO86401.1 hypothetical protein QLX69_04135 [Limosilactobacillus oris]
MSDDTMQKFKLMMNLDKKNQQFFEKELKKINWEDATSNNGEFPVGTLMTSEDMNEVKKQHLSDSLTQSNQKSIDELNDLRVSSANSTTGYLNDISRSLRSISNSLSGLKDHVTFGKVHDWSD